MSKSIEVSPKHGLNPCLTLCFFCGESKGIALMGRVRERDQNGRAVKGSDIEAPKEMVMDYEPCDTCKEHMSHGVTLLGVTEFCADSRPPISQNEGQSLYPTGRWCVMTSETANRCFNIGKELHDGEKLLLPDDLLQKIIEQGQPQT